jgi:hypothetical protein
MGRSTGTLSANSFLLVIKIASDGTCALRHLSGDHIGRISGQAIASKVPSGRLLVVYHLMLSDAKAPIPVPATSEVSLRMQ